MKRLLVIGIFLSLTGSVLASERGFPMEWFRPAHRGKTQFTTPQIRPNQNGLRPGTKEFFKEMFPRASHRNNVKADPYEPNDTTTDAYPIAYGDTLEQGVIDPAGDVDFFKFTGTAGDTITIDINAQSLGSWLDSYIYLYDTDSVTILTSNDDWHSLDSRILNYVLPSTGIYFIKVREYNHPNDGGPDYFYHIWITNVPISFGAISGTVTDSTTGLPIEYVEVDVYDTTYYWGGISYGYTDSTGYYIIDGLETGGYKVRTWNWYGYADKYYNNKLSWNSADIVYVTAPDTLNNINFSIYIGGKIKGSVYDWTKSPLENVEVDAFNSNSGEVINSGWTDSLGTYTITGLPNGYCKLWALPLWMGDTTHAFEWYNNRDNWSSADTVNVVAPDSVIGINFTLEDCGYITGNVYEALKGPIQDADVIGWMYINNFYGWLPYFFQDQTRVDGSYRLTNLRTGTYKVSAEKSGYQRRWFNDKPDSTTADLVSVTMPDTTFNIDFYLPASGVEEKPYAKSKKQDVRLYPCYPNPFQSSIIVRYSLTVPGYITLKVYDVAGRFVKTLVNDKVSSGFHRITWNGKDKNGNSVASGIYFYRLVIGGSSLTSKILLLR